MRKEGYRSRDSLPGQSTHVDELNAKGLPRDPGGYHPVQQDGGAQDPSGTRRRERAQPADDGSDNEIKRPAQPVHNVPGPSGTSPDGKSLHKDKVRTKGVPGDQYNPEPIDQSKGILKRRTMSRESEGEMEAGMKKPVPSGGQRQRKQRSKALRYYDLRYKNKAGFYQNRALRRHHRIKNRGGFKRDQAKRNLAQYAPKYKRRPGAGYSDPADRTRDHRNDKTRTNTKVVRKTRNNRKSPAQNRAKGRRKTRLAFLKVAEWTRFPEILVYMESPDFEVLEIPNPSDFAYVLAYNDDTGEVCYVMADAQDEELSMDLEEFIDCSYFVNEEDIGIFFGTLDHLYDEEDSLGPDPADVASRYSSDETGEDDMYEEASPERVAEFYRKQVWNPQRSDDSRQETGTPGPDQATKNDYEGLPSWMGPIKDERENPTPAQGMSVTRDRPGAPGSAKVIPRGQGFVGKTAANREVVAAKMAEILGGTAPGVHERSQGLTVKRSKILPKHAMWLFDVSGGEKTHRVRLQAIRKGNNKTLANADLRISCDCNFWRWQGPEHWAKASGYLYGRPVGTAAQPLIRDPEGQHKACKHVVAVLKKAQDYRFRSVKEVERSNARMRETQEARRNRSRTAALTNDPMGILVRLLFPSAERVAARAISRSDV